MRYCNGCACEDCANNPEHEETRLEIIQQILARDPNAFRSKIEKRGNQSASAGDGVSIWSHIPSIHSFIYSLTHSHIAPLPQFAHLRGCKCKRTGCLKKYCECFEANIPCSDRCKCMTCKNFVGGAERALALSQLGAAEAEALVDLKPPTRNRQRRRRSRPSTSSSDDDEDEEEEEDQEAVQEDDDSETIPVQEAEPEPGELELESPMPRSQKRRRSNGRRRSEQTTTTTTTTSNGPTKAKTKSEQVVTVVASENDAPSHQPNLPLVLPPTPRAGIASMEDGPGLVEPSTPSAYRLPSILSQDPLMTGSSPWSILARSPFVDDAAHALWASRQNPDAPPSFLLRGVSPSGTPLRLRDSGRGASASGTAPPTPQWINLVLRSPDAAVKAAEPVGSYPSSSSGTSSVARLSRMSARKSTLSSAVVPPRTPSSLPSPSISASSSSSSSSSSVGTAHRGPLFLESGGITAADLLAREAFQQQQQQQAPPPPELLCDEGPLSHPHSNSHSQAPAPPPRTRGRGTGRNTNTNTTPARALLSTPLGSRSSTSGHEAPGSLLLFSPSSSFARSPVPPALLGRSPASSAASPSVRVSGPRTLSSNFILTERSLLTEVNRAISHATELIKGGTKTASSQLSPRVDGGGGAII